MVNLHVVLSQAGRAATASVDASEALILVSL